MMAELIDRQRLKADMKELLADAQVSPKAMTALYMGIAAALSLVDTLAGGSGLLSTFLSILAALLNSVLLSGFVLYCMAIRRGERAEYLTLFDGFSFVEKIIALNLVMSLFIWLWGLLFVIPGVIAAYRYRFALYNLYDNPGVGVMEALDMSRRQTAGYKGQLFALDLSYLGWRLLGAAPSIVYSTAVYMEIAESMMSVTGFAGTLSAGTGASLTGLLPPWGWTLAIGLWSMAVSLFYLPSYQCVELGYFEIAKSTSGVGEGGRHALHDGPDSMGGY